LFYVESSEAHDEEKPERLTNTKQPLIWI